MTAPFSSATGSDVRVRFCPSPTGTPHVGLVRTALFNWAYARHTGGKLVFRIEDTDAARDSEESYAQIIEALRWLQLDWDEGVEVGGPHGPYRQSERADIYADAIAQLTAAGHVYESYVTPEEMEARNVANGRDPKQGYDNHERDLTDAQRQAFRDEGRAPALRLRVPDRDLSFQDLVRGDITFPQGSFPDFVVVRPNGKPLYTFTNPPRRRPDGDHPRPPWRGPAVVDAAADRAVRGAPRDRSRSVHPAVRSPAVRDGGRATRSSRSGIPSPTCSTTGRTAWCPKDS
ncbi:glutamate--tRNA ligase family protein [Curtobacterium sp. MCPF17_052]|nr:glutamate--tRNA ligase family protein [Curtobacterium sp. MCPF17_052]WIB12957.1 glutamate--tRNA ligase family protein [Curtobacterium sp. MCPF17_052]